MFNNIFCEMTIKIVFHLRGGGRLNGGTILISSWKCNYSIYLEIQVTQYGYPSNIHTFMPSICSWCVIIHFSIILVIKTALRKSDIFRHSKSLLLIQFSTYRNRTGFIVKRKQVHIANYLRIPINCYFFYQFLKLFILPKKYTHFKKFHKIYSFFFQAEDGIRDFAEWLEFRRVLFRSGYVAQWHVAMSHSGYA